MQYIIISYIKQHHCIQVRMNNLHANHKHTCIRNTTSIMIVKPSQMSSIYTKTVLNICCKCNVK